MINRDSLEYCKKRLVEIGYSEDVIRRDLFGLNPDQQVEHLKGVVFRNSKLYNWDLSNYPKLKSLNKMAEEDFTDEEEKAYSEAAKKFYGSGEWVENIPQDEMWLGSNGW